MSLLTQIKPLTQEERQLAHAAAEEAVMRDLGERHEVTDKTDK